MSIVRTPYYQRIMQKIGPISVIVGIIMLLFGFRDKIFSADLINEKNSPYVFMGALYIVLGIASWVYKFIEIGNLRGDYRGYDYDMISEKYQRKIDEIKKELTDSILRTENKDFDPAVLDNIIKEKITFSLDYTLKDYIETKYSANAIRNNQLKQVEAQIKDLQSGVNIQIGKLSRSGTINLIIGLFTTLVAIGVLVNLILNVKSIHFDTTKDFLIYLTPRLSLAIFIEVFSFFFLKLYKTNLEDVKYFHNERTNIDSKIIALKTSLLVEKDDILIEIIKSFSNVERNFILKKEETTVNIERIKMDNEQEINLISKLSDIIEKIKK
jgi:hypothetical protein